MLEDTLSGLTPEGPSNAPRVPAGRPSQVLALTILQSAAHFDVFMGLTMPLVAEPQSASAGGGPGQLLHLGV